jgi:hypothetical protein
MAKQQPHPNQGILYKNAYKVEGSKQPDARGDVTTVCPHCQKPTWFEISGWLRMGRKGRFTSLAVKPHQERQRPQDAAANENEAPQQDAPAEAPGGVLY